MAFDARDTPDAYDRWRGEYPALSSVYDITPRDTPFRVQATGLLVGEAVVARFAFSGMTYLRDARRVRTVPDDSIAVQLVEAGGFKGAAGDLDIAPGPGKAVFIDHERPLVNHSVETRGATVSLPRRLLPGGDVGALHGRVISAGGFALLRDYLQWLGGAYTRMPLGAEARTEAALGTVIAAAFRSEAAPDPLAAGVLGAVAVERARRFVERQDLTSPIDTSKVVAASGVSRSTLYRLLSPVGGVQTLIWTARLEAARGALLNPRYDGRIADVAADFGFPSQAHFSRRFKTHFGFSPKTLRPF